MFSRKPVNAALTICAFVLALGALVTLPRIGSAEAPSGVTQVWTLQGRVYEGEVGDESSPFQGVNVAIYGANASYPTQGTFIRDTSTDVNGWFGIEVYDDDLALYDYIYLLETDPVGYVSVGASTIEGTVRTANWIEFAAPLEGKDLTGNKFWDQPETSSWDLQGRVYEGQVGDESTPLDQVTVSAYGSNNAYPNAGELITSTTTNADGWYSLEVSEGYEFYHIRESDRDGYTSVGATSIDGTVQDWNWIEFAAPLEGQDLTGNKFWDLPAEAEWWKFINGEPWDPELTTTVETSDTIEVKDVIATLPNEALALVEEWNPTHLKLRDWAITPEGSTVEPDAGILTWQLPEGGQVFTLTKWFHVEPCTWLETVLDERLSTGDQLVDQRAVIVQKEPPQLWIESAYDPTVLPGDVTTFTLSYGNMGGYENDVAIRNEFPAEAPFAWSEPPPDEADGSEALWLLDDLAKGDEGEITVAVAIQESVATSQTITIWDWIHDHVGEQRAAVETEFNVAEAPEAEWWKFINGEPWDPQLTTTVETGDVIEVTDVVDSPEPFNLVESWDPDLLKLLASQATSGQINTASGVLDWDSPTEPMGPMTLTKRFEVKGGPWPRAIIEEILEIDGAPEPLSRLVPIEHLLPPIILHRLPDPSYAEREITVHPYPPVANWPTEICVELRNPTDEPHDVEVQFKWASFGIGIDFTPINGLRPVHLPPHSTVKECIHWVPPTSGNVCLEVELFIDGYQPQRSQLNVDSDEPLEPLESHSRTFPVRNPFSRPVTVTLGLVPHAPGWSLGLSQDTLPNMQPGEERDVTLTVTPPAEPPPAGTVVVDVEAYADGQLIGGFRKTFRPPITLHPTPDPPYAEREITVHPYPPLAGEPTEICVELRNPTDEPQDVEVQFKWANFGIGLPFTPINGLLPVHLPPHSTVNKCLHWVPPASGHVCFEVELFMEGHQPQRSQRNVDIDEPLEPLEPHSLTFPVRNPFSQPMTVTLGLIPHAPGWGLELSQDTLLNMEAREKRDVTLTVTPPAGLPAAGTAVVDVEAYADGQLIGGFRKTFRPPITLHPTPDPPYAEREITVHPYPPMANWPTEICVELRNPTAEPHDVQVQFSWAAFGMGIDFTPINGLRPVHLPAHSVVNECIHWVPPTGGHICLQVELLHEDYETQRSQRNVDVAEVLVPGVPDSVVFKVGNPLDERATVTLGMITHLPGWQMELSPDTLPDMEPGEKRDVTLTVTPPGNLPNDGDVVVEVEAFANNRLIGGFRKTFRPPVPVHRPKDPIYAESEIFIDPYPVIPGVPTKLGVEVFNPTDHDQIVNATFSVAHFGIGLPFEASHITPNPIQIFVPRHGAARGHTIWQPPSSWQGHACVRVTLEMQGHEPVWSQRNIDLGEPLRPGEPHELTFPVGVWPHTEPMTVTLGVVPHMPGWRLEVSPEILPNVTPGQPQMATLTVVPPSDAQLGNGEPIVDVEAFGNGELIGGFRKLDIPPVPIHKPHERMYAESEILVDPYPPQAEQPTQVSAVLQNASDTSATVELTFGWADFGAGIPFTTTGMTPATRTLTLGAHATDTARVTWTPERSGHQCLQVIVTDPAGAYEPQRSQRNVDVSERPPCGTTKTFTFTVHNNSPISATIDIGLITFNVPPDWTVTTEPSGSVEIEPYGEAVIKVIVEIPCPSTLSAMAARQALYALQEESGSVPTVDVEAYADGELKGGIEIQFPSMEPEKKFIYLPVVLKNTP